MKRTMQAAAMLCSHRAATAFVLSSSAASLLHRVSSPATSTAAEALAHVSASSQQQRRRSTRAGTARVVTALRAEGEAQEEGLTNDERAMKALLKEDFGANVEIDPKRVAVLFDFDGTIGDTETPAMEVAFWELAPYFPEAASERSLRWCLRA